MSLCFVESIDAMIIAVVVESIETMSMIMVVVLESIETMSMIIVVVLESIKTMVVAVVVENIKVMISILREHWIQFIQCFLLIVYYTGIISTRR
jgi:hypothetical protein